VAVPGTKGRDWVIAMPCGPIPGRAELLQVKLLYTSRRIRRNTQGDQPQSGVRAVAEQRGRQLCRGVPIC